ncbi:uncharacterized protein [Euwallacea similis]|uniref:uncharacterized protein isoform X1 n=1 Tax=Euwallacea similis TaxID=1736056 RepID=UPI00344C3399
MQTTFYLVLTTKTRDLRHRRRIILQLWKMENLAYWSIFSISIFATVLFFSVLLCLAIVDCVHRCTSFSIQSFRPFRRTFAAPLPDDNGIYNISSRVQGQQSQYPDAYLSVDHITISNELNKPPKYDDAPPSYEEAVKLAMAHSNSIQTFQAEQVNNTRPQAHSSTTTTVVVPAVAGQSTE